MVSFAGCRIAQEPDVYHCLSVYIGGWQTVVGHMGPYSLQAKNGFSSLEWLKKKQKKNIF